MSISQALVVRAVVLCEAPDTSGSDPDGASCILEDLGCRVTRARFDLSDLDPLTLLQPAPTVVIVDAQDHLSLGIRARRLLTGFEPLLETPTILVTTVPRLAAIDFSLGFGDFVLYPIIPAELYARIRQLDWKAAAFGSDERIKVGDLVIDIAGHEVHLGGKRIEFTHQEFELLRFLAQNRGRVYSREQLLQKVWGFEYGGGTRTVDIHVRRVRAKLGTSSSASGMGGLIATVRNVGYKMR
ncbi:MAG: response regulator transcription factor [Myxococcales bacterium]|nr:response regulator transcription factor [Myxococcales bacterium]